jgi:hypothetical protein
MSIYTRFTPDDIVEANPTAITTGLWSGDVGTLSGSNTLYTLETQRESDSAYYYIDVYDKDPATEDTAEIQFAVTYGHVNGGGAPTLADNELATLPTKAIYSQYRNLLLNQSETRFTFNGVPSDHIYVINFQRARIREQLDPGNWILPLSGANGIKKFIDDSGQTLGALTANSKAGRVYNVVWGDLTGPSGSTIYSSSYTPTGAGYGLVYPDLGVIVLNPDAICPEVGFLLSGSRIAASGSIFPGPTGSASPASKSMYQQSDIENRTNFLPLAPVTASQVDYDNADVPTFNHLGLYVSMLSALLDETADVELRARSAESISSTHYFVRLRNKEYNYSNNPTFYNADTGTLVQSDFRNDPRVYITTVGLYNDANELLAVAKLSKPVRKSFDEELLLRVRLDF